MRLGSFPSNDFQRLESASYRCFRDASGANASVLAMQQRYRTKRGRNVMPMPRLWATGRGGLWPSQFPHGFASRRFPPYFMVPSWALSSPRVGRRKFVAANSIRHRSLMTLAPNSPCNSGQSKIHRSQAIIHSDSARNQALHTAKCLSNSTLHPEPSMLQKCAQRCVEQPAIHRQAL